MAAVEVTAVAVRAEETPAAVHQAAMPAPAQAEILPHQAAMEVLVVAAADQPTAARQVQAATVPLAAMQDQIQTMALRTLQQVMAVQVATVEARQTLAQAEQAEPGLMVVKQGPIQTKAMQMQAAAPAATAETEEQLTVVETMAAPVVTQEQAAMVPQTAHRQMHQVATAVQVATAEEVAAPSTAHSMAARPKSIPVTHLLNPWATPAATRPA